jgi:phosphatidylinositol dimannoside acyltransferase
VVPPRLAYALCNFLGDVAYRALPRQRRSVRENLARVTGECGGRALDRLARGVFRSGAKYYYDTFKVPSLTDAELRRVASMQGWERLDRALERGKGVVLCTAHLGSPSPVAQLLAMRGHVVTTPAEPVRPRRLFDLISRARGSRGIKLTPVGPGTARELTDALRRNEVVGIVVDRDVQKTGVPVEFFGSTARLPAGPVTLALRTGAAMVPAFAYRSDSGRFEGQIQEAMELERTGNLREDIRRNTQKLATVLEEAIGRCPEQWIVFQPVWPAGQSEDGMGAAL